MANFTKEDSHFVVFFDVDKSLQTLPKSRIGGQLDESEKVTVLWKTSKMLEDGTEVVGDMPYDGIVVFSGSKYFIHHLNCNVYMYYNLNIMRSKFCRFFFLCACKIALKTSCNVRCMIKNGTLITKFCF